MSDLSLSGSWGDGDDASYGGLDAPRWSHQVPAKRVSLETLERIAKKFEDLGREMRIAKGEEP